MLDYYDWSSRSAGLLLSPELTIVDSDTFVAPWRRKSVLRSDLTKDRGENDMADTYTK